MKKIASLMALVFAMSALAAQSQLSALFDYSVFYLPESNQPYVETYLRFDAWNLTFVEQEDSRFRATVEVTLVARCNDTVAYLKKYDLLSPFTSSKEQTNFTFTDLQRFGLNNGIYDLEMTLRDKNSDSQPVVLHEKLNVYYPKGEPNLSHVQLMESATPTVNENMLSRNGYDMVPYIDYFLPSSVSTIHPYFEIYNLDKEIGNNSFSVNISVIQQENGFKMPKVGWQHTYQAAKKVVPVYADLDLEELPSGNYLIVAEVLNEQGEPMLMKNVPVMRSNPNTKEPSPTDAQIATSFAVLITDEEALSYYIDALYPIASYAEQSAAKQLLAGSTLAEKQSFFYRFWKARDDVNPEGKWKEYQQRLTYVEENYTYPKTPGYRTDRGRVYLQYGPPDYVRDEKNFVGALNNVRWSLKEPATNSYGDGTSANEGFIYYLPYQIWRYNNIPGDYNNRVFLFWDEFRGGYYKLLNSNARGEIQTPGWERMLSRYTMEEGAIGEVGQQFNRGY